MWRAAVPSENEYFEAFIARGWLGVAPTAGESNSSGHVGPLLIATIRLLLTSFGGSLYYQPRAAPPARHCASLRVI